MSVLEDSTTVMLVWAVTVLFSLAFALLGSVMGVVAIMAFASGITVVHLVFTVEESVGVARTTA